MTENVITMIFLMLLGCFVVGGVLLFLAAIWSAGNE